MFGSCKMVAIAVECSYIYVHMNLQIETSDAFCTIGSEVSLPITHRFVPLGGSRFEHLNDIGKVSVVFSFGSKIERFVQVAYRLFYQGYN